MGYGVPNMGGGGAGGLISLLGGLFGGLHQGNIDKGDRKQKAAESAANVAKTGADITHEGIENKVAQAGLDATNLAATQQNAQTLVTNTNRQLLTHPDMLKDPALRKAYLDASSSLHMPVAMDKDGNIDVDSTKSKQFGDYTPDEVAKLMAMDPSVRAYATRDVGGKPKGFDTTKAIQPYDQMTKRLTAQAAGTRATTGQKAEAHKEYVDDVKLPIWSRLEKARAIVQEHTSATDTAKAYAVINKMNAEAGRASAEAAAVGPRLQIAEQSLGLRSQELSVRLQELQYNTNPGSFKNLHLATQALDEYTSRTEGQLEGAKKALATYAATKNGGTILADDPIGIKLQGSIGRLESLVYSATQQSNKARSEFTNFQHQGVAISKQSGKQASILPRANQGGSEQSLGDAPPGAKNGTRGKMADGTPAVVRDGKLYKVQ
jgi:hypothetical protein